MVICLENLHEVEISDEIWKRIKGFLPVIRKLMEEPDFSEVMLIHLAIWEGLDKMFEGVIPDDPRVLFDSFKKMNQDDPEFIGKFIVQTIERGDIIMLTEESKRLTKEWKKRLEYI